MNQCPIHANAFAEKMCEHLKQSKSVLRSLRLMKDEASGDARIFFLAIIVQIESGATLSESLRTASIFDEHSLGIIEKHEKDHRYLEAFQTLSQK